MTTKKQTSKYTKYSRQNVIYVYATPDNKNYVKTLSLQFNVPESEIINRMIEATQKNMKLNLTIFVPKFVKKAEAWTTKFLKKEEK